MNRIDELFARARDERGVTRLAYLHCDHFEPWRWDTTGVRGISDENADAVATFLRMVGEKAYARRLTLFLKSPIRATDRPHRYAKSNPNDEIYFMPVGRRGRVPHDRALQAIVAAGHELQVHIHHERFTRNDWYSTSPDRPENAASRDFLTNRSTPEMDAARLELYVAMTLRLFRRATGLPFERWMFVHGMWSLNGSDRDFCTVDSEIALLQRAGCAGDFTFPAPRLHCNPAADHPYLVEPIVAPKAYDAPDAHKRPADGSAAGNDFFIWSTAVSARFCSLDLVSRSFEALAQDPLRWAEGLVAGAVEHEGAVYVKTHAHSMMSAYFAGDLPVFPHTHPAVERLFGTLMDAASRQGIAWDPITASEAYDRFVARPAD